LPIFRVNLLPPWRGNISVMVLDAPRQFPNIVVPCNFGNFFPLLH
jgi:hypothetical protein